MSIDIYSTGIAVVCACALTDTPQAEIEAAATDHLNRVSPVQFEGERPFAAKLSDDKAFATGQPNPCPCDQLPGERMHYLLEY